LVIKQSDEFRHYGDSLLIKETVALSLKFQI
jgi:hypothetical protein